MATPERRQQARELIERISFNTMGRDWLIKKHGSLRAWRQSAGYRTVLNSVARKGIGSFGENLRAAALDMPGTALFQRKNPDGTPADDPAFEPDEDAFAVLEGLLKRWDLGGLTDFVWDRLTEGQPESRIMLELRDQPEYKRRFAGLEAMREQGLPVLSEAEYLQQETAYKAILRQAGADPEEYDDPQDFVDYFAGNIAPQELSERAELWQVITQAPDMTAKARASFQEFAQLPDVSDEQLFDTLLGADDTLLRQYQEKTGQPLNARTIRMNLERALREEAARFQGGGGQVAETREGRVGLMGAESETF